MMFDLMDLGVGWQQFLAMVALYAVRPMVMLGAFPATDEPILTATSRFQFGLVVAVFTAAGAPAAAIEAVTAQTMALMVVREAAIGLVLALVAGKVFWVAQSVGALVDNLAGYNNVQLLNPSSPEQSTPLSDILLQLASAVFLVMGGLTFLAAALFESWRWWPVWQPLPEWPGWTRGDGAAAVGAGLDSMMRLIASVAMPLLFLLTLIDIAMALVSRAAKGVDTSSIATPVKAATAIFSLILFASLFMDEIKSGLQLGEGMAMLRRLGVPR
ncbi:type III secretion system export apparatus subunit SctT [soil metagenome]